MRGFPPVNIFHCCWHDHSSFDVDDNDDDKNDVDNNDDDYMSQFLLLGKFEYGGGPIFKVVLEC